MKIFPPLLSLALCALWMPTAAHAETVFVSSLDLSHIEQGWGEIHADKSVEGHKLRIAGTSFGRGVGTHADSEFVIDLAKGSSRFNASVGVDDEVAGSPSSIRFEVLADGGKSLWSSGVMKAGDPAKAIDVDVTGLDHLTLKVDDAGDSNQFDHADWAEARLEVTAAQPKIVGPPVEAAEILTPKPAASPRLTGAKVFGVRPGAPFLFTLTTTGERPMEFTADALPAGLHLDTITGRITGTLTQAGESLVKVRAKNARGAAERSLRLVCGENIALTPPMGWNSWNCWAGAVDQDKVLKSARALVSSGLASHGWTYVNTDDTWQGARDPQSHGLQTNKKFPAMKALCDEIHGLGLKAGIYSTPWITSYASYAGGSADNEAGDWKRQGSGEAVQHRVGEYPFAQPDAQQWAAWGFDYLKYDWHPIDVPEVRRMTEALRGTGRDIVYSLSNTATFDSAGEYAKLANCWRTTGDIVDNWKSMSGIGFSQDRWAAAAGPGHWNDPDMLVVGEVGWGPKLHPTHLTPNEQYTHISLWCLFSAPLLLGCDLDKLDGFTLGLLTNDEVLDLDQDILGKAARRVAKDGATEVYSKELEDGSRAVGIFNLSKLEVEGTVKWSDIGVSGKQIVRDLWRQQDVGTFEGQYTVKVPAHGVALVRISPTK